MEKKIILRHSGKQTAHNICKAPGIIPWAAISF